MVQVVDGVIGPLAEDVKVYLKKKGGEMTEEATNRIAHRINSFLNYLGSNNLSTITENETTGWIKSLSHLAPGTINNYICDLQGFLQFENAWKSTHYFVPECIKESDLYEPHFFTTSEKRKLYQEIDNYVPVGKCSLPWIRLELPMAVRICDGCGTRITETLCLKMQDVNLKAGVLKMVNTKNNKQRYVPMTQRLTEILRKYCDTMGITDNPNALLFPRRSWEEPLIAQDIRHRCIAAMIKIGIIDNTIAKEKTRRSRGPCVHNLRSTFAICSLRQALANGENQESFLEILSVYLGHDSLKETEKYLKFAVDIFPEELDKIDKVVNEILPEEDLWEKYGL